MSWLNFNLKNKFIGRRAETNLAAQNNYVHEMNGYKEINYINSPVL